MQSTPNSERHAHQPSSHSAVHLGFEDMLHSLETQCYRKVSLSKASHQQFPAFKVTLLVFESADAVKSFLNAPEAVESSSLSTDQWTALRPGELVAACLSGDEENHARHIPIFGLLDKSAASLNDQVNDLVNRSAAITVSTPQECAVWRSTAEDDYCTNEEFEKLALECAQLGDKIVRSHLYTLEQSPQLLASEARRMNFKERWTYAKVKQGVPTSSETVAHDWITEPGDDTLLPSLSIEWPADQPASAASLHRLYSKTGYYVEHENTAPSVVILNRHYPHWRGAEVHTLQLIAPNRTIHRYKAEPQEKDGRLDQVMALFRQLQQSETSLKAASRGLLSNPPLAQALLSQLCAFFTSKQVSQARSPALCSAVTQMATKAHEIIQASSGGRRGMAPVLPESGALVSLLCTALSCFHKAFTLKSEEAMFLTTAMQAAITKSSSGPSISGEVIECFLIIYRLAAANAAPLCGKAVKKEPEWIELEAVEDEAVQDPAAVSPASEPTEMTLDAIGGLDEALQAESDSEEEVQRSARQRKPTARKSTAESDLFGSYDDDCKASEETDSEVEESINASGKRFPRRSLQQAKTKQTRVERSSSSSSSASSSPESSDDEVDEPHFKKLLGSIMTANGRESKLTELTDKCASVLKASVTAELAEAEPLPQEAMQICRTAILTCQKNEEHGAWQLMTAVELVCSLAEEDKSEDWHWFLLTLAFQANNVIINLAKKASEAYLAMLERGRSDEGEEGKKALQKELKRKNGDFSDALCDLLERARYHLRDSTSYRSTSFFDEDRKPKPRGQRSGSCIDYTKQIPVSKAVVKALRKGPSSEHHKQARHSTFGSMEHDCTDKTKESAAKSRTPVVIFSYLSLGSEGKGARSKQGLAMRFRGTVFDLLFQTYFSPLIHFLTEVDLNGEVVKTPERNWFVVRRYLLFRLMLIQKLTESSKSGTAIFASRFCSNLVIAPAMDLPYSDEGIDETDASCFVCPALQAKRGDATEEESQVVWRTIGKALTCVRDDLVRLAKKKDPSQSIVTRTGTS